MIDHAKRLREIHEWLADETDFILVKRAAFEAADEIDRLKAERDELRDLGLVVCDYVRRCQLYGPADALRGSADRFRKKASDSCPNEVVNRHGMDGAEGDQGRRHDEA